MSKRIEERVIEEANYIINNNATIRETAKFFGLSHNAIHLHIKNYLPFISSTLYEKVQNVIKINKKESLERATKKNVTMDFRYMKNYDNVIEEAKYYIENQSTKTTSKFFNVSQSAIMYHFNKILPKVDIELYNTVKNIMKNNYNKNIA